MSCIFFLELYQALYTEFDPDLAENVSYSQVQDPALPIARQAPGRLCDLLKFWTDAYYRNLVSNISLIGALVRP